LRSKSKKNWSVAGSRIVSDVSPKKGK
jgi:hypothetical protein